METTEVPSATDNAIAAAACEDLSTKCESFKKYCDKNTYVNKRCQKTCGKCSK